MSKRPDISDCPQTLERLEAFADGDLSANVRSEVASHLADCSNCAREHELILAIQGELHSLPELDMPSAAVAKVLEQTAEPSWLDRTREAIHTSWLRPQWVGATVAAVLIALVGVALLLRPAPTPPLTTDPVVAQAVLQARYALALVGSVNHRAGLELRDEVLRKRLVEPTARGLTRSFERALDSVPIAPEATDQPAAETTRRQT
ncbi:MAG: zf-HC2 domain-containing protein [Thermoanaerobaculia bacterium]